MAIAYHQLLDLDLPQEELDDYIDGIEGQIADKAESVALVVLDLEGTAKKIRDEEKRLATRRRAIQSRLDNLKAYLLRNMLDLGMNKIEGIRVTVGYQNSPPSCKVLNVELLPESCKKLIPAMWQPDAKAIIAMWNDTGEQVPGADVTQRVHLRIR